MSEASGEYATEPVPDERTVPWFRVATVAAMVAFSLPTFVTGIEVASAIDGRSAVLAILCGNLLLSVIGAVFGTIGARARLSSYMLARIAFGARGSVIVNLAFALSLLGWFGVNIDLFGAAVIRLASDAYGIDVPVWTAELGAGVVMTLTTLYGFRAINVLSLVLVPVLVVVTAMLITKALGAAPLSESIARASSHDLDFGDAMSAIVGGVVIGAIILPDITRFIRERYGGILTGIISYLVVGSVVQGAGGLAAMAFENNDLLDVMIVIGLGWAAFAIVIAGSWILNSLNLYSTMLSVEATIPALPNRLLIVVLGVFGTIAAFINILDMFLAFLFYLAVIFAPVAGVIAVDYLWVRQDAYHGERVLQQPPVRWLALAAWLVGAAVALAGSLDLLLLSDIAALDAIGVAALVYAVLCRIGEPRVSG